MDSGTCSDEIRDLKDYLSRIVENEYKVEEDSLAMLKTIEKMDHRTDIMMIQVEKLKILREQYFQAVRQQSLDNQYLPLAKESSLNGASIGRRMNERNLFDGSLPDVRNTSTLYPPSAISDLYKFPNLMKHHESVSSSNLSEGEISLGMFESLQLKSDVNVPEQRRYPNNVQETSTQSENGVYSLHGLKSFGEVAHTAEDNRQHEKSSILDECGKSLQTVDEEPLCFENHQKNLTIERDLSSSLPGSDTHIICASSTPKPQSSMNVPVMLEETFNVQSPPQNSSIYRTEPSEKESKAATMEAVLLKQMMPVHRVKKDIESEFNPNEHLPGKRMNTDIGQNVAPLVQVQIMEDENNSKSVLEDESRSSKTEIENTKPPKQDKEVAKLAEKKKENKEVEKHNANLLQKTADSLYPLPSNADELSSDMEDIYQENDSPLTASAAYQSLIGAAPLSLPMPRNQVEIEESDSEDDVEKALAMGVHQKKPAPQNDSKTYDKVPVEKEKSSALKKSVINQPRKSISAPASAIKNKLSKASRKALGLDSDSDEAEATLKKSLANEDSDEFDFYE